MAAKPKHGDRERDERLPAKSVLQLRRTDSGLRVVGEPPARHVFTPAFLEREMAHGASLRITVPTRDGDPDLVYQLVGFEQVPDGEGATKANLTAWICDRIED